MYILVIVFCISTVKPAMFHKIVLPTFCINMAAFIRQQVQSYFLERKYLFWKEILVSNQISLSLFAAVQMTINQDWFRQWLHMKQVPSHYLNQCWNTSGNVVCKMAAILLNPQWGCVTGGSVCRHGRFYCNLECMLMLGTLGINEDK